MSPENLMRRSVEVKPSGAPRQYEDAGRSVTFVPLTIKRRHTAKLLLPPPGCEDARISHAPKNPPIWCDSSVTVKHFNRTRPGMTPKSVLRKGL